MKTSQTSTRVRRKRVGVSLRLYLAGELPQSVVAVSNLQRVCREAALDDVAVEIVDTLQAPERSLEDGIVVTPTLVRLSPEPRITIIGSLAEFEEVRAALGLMPARESRP